MSDEFRKNLMGPEPTLLPAETGDLRSSWTPGEEALDLVEKHPTSSLLWAILAEEAWAEGRTIDSYAYSRVGYHRGLDSLRRNGWRGSGPIPWEHEPNRGFLRALYSLGRAAGPSARRKRHSASPSSWPTRTPRPLPPSKAGATSPAFRRKGAVLLTERGSVSRTVLRPPDKGRVR